MKIQTATLLRIALGDESTLSLVGPPDLHFGRNTHAAIEKSFKALINEQGQRFRYTHDLDGLRKDLENLGETLPVLPIVLGSLNEYATIFRYGDDAPLRPLDRPNCQQAVRLVREYVTARIQALGQAAPPSAPPPP